MRDPRKCENYIKYSYQLYLIGRTNIPILFKDIIDKYNILDESVHSKNNILLAPFSDWKRNEVVPILQVRKGETFDSCATYKRKTMKT